MRVLVIQYLPRGERSRTKRLLAAFRSRLADADVVEVDLAACPPAAFDAVRLPAYVRRNYGGEDLSGAEREALAEADRLAQQVVDADAVVLAFPMFNFSVPAAVKAWMDAVMQKGRTWTAEGGAYRGLKSGCRALVLYTAGGAYDGPRASWDHAGPLARHAFEFMGFDDVRVVRADSQNAAPGIAEEALLNGMAAAREVARDWIADAAVTA